MILEQLLSEILKETGGGRTIEDALKFALQITAENLREQGKVERYFDQEKDAYVYYCTGNF